MQGIDPSIERLSSGQLSTCDLRASALASLVRPLVLAGIYTSLSYTTNLHLSAGLPSSSNTCVYAFAVTFLKQALERGYTLSCKAQLVAQICCSQACIMWKSVEPVPTICTTLALALCRKHCHIRESLSQSSPPLHIFVVKMHANV